MDVVDQETKQKAALILLKAGHVTVGEAARLRGVSRQALHKASRGFKPRKIRELYLKSLWKKVVNQLR
jgi:predicted HTH domain antitoxin